MQCRIQEQ